MILFRRGLRPTQFLSSCALLSTSVLALMSQNAWAATAADADAVEEIVVTGTRIKSADAASAQPLTVISSTTIAQEKSTNIEDILRKDPSIDFGQGITANSNNGGVGASEAELRNLGPSRTLVLVNGYRFPLTDTQGSANAVDFNSIPVEMVDHIDVLRNGASALYGADAVGGVINVVTKKNFEGVEAHGQVGETDKEDGLNWNVGSLLGINFERGNVMIDVETNRREAISQGNRSWASNAVLTGTDGECANCSSKLPYLTGRYTIDGVRTGTRAFIPDSNSPTGFDSVSVADTTSALAGDSRLYYSPANGRYFFDLTKVPDLTGELDRRQIAFVGHYDIFDDVTATLEGFYTDRRSQEQLNPEPLSATITTHKYPGLLIPAVLTNGSTLADGTVLAPGSANPYNPFGADITSANFRPFGGGPRVYDDEVETYRIRAELAGTFLNDYTWVAGYFVGKSIGRYTVHNEVNFKHLGQETGQFACAEDAASGCHLANFFTGLSASDVSYLEYDNIRNSATQTDSFYGSVSGPVIELPAGLAQASIQVEQRNESGYDNPSSVVVNGDGDSDASPTSGAYSVTSVSIETEIPVLKDLPLVKKLTVSPQGRYDYYTSFGRSMVYQVGVNWAINDDIRLRFNQGTQFRAPQIKELYGGLFQNFPTYNGDPCDTNGGASVGSATCNSALRAVGVNPATYQSQLDQVPNPQVPTINGGNPKLRPETAQQINAGFVLTPTFIPNLSIAADYYNIHVRNAITSLDPNSIISQCYGPQQLASACSLITRSTLTGDVSSVYAPNINFGYENTDGVDFDITYGISASDMGVDLPGRFAFSDFTEYLIHDTVTNADGTPNEEAGTFDTSRGGGTIEPRWKSTVNLGYADDTWAFNWTTRIYGGSKANPSDVGGGDTFGNHIGATVYHDLNIGYTYDNLNIQVGMDNVFDRDPPLLLGDLCSCNGPSSGSYDFTGRFVYMKASITFKAPHAPEKHEEVAAPLPVAPPLAAQPAVERQRNFQVFFDFDKSDITKEAAAVIQAAADTVKAGNVARIDVIGHTDTVGSASYNLELSSRRAEAVSKQLVVDGVAEKEIVTSAAGKSGLLVPTADGVREAQNRRAEIHLE